MSDNAQSGYAAGCGINIIGGLVTHCVISNNAAVGSGGGINITGGLCENSLITASRAWSGGGAYVDGGVLRNCVIRGCVADCGGGAVVKRGLLQNCTIAGNQEVNAEQHGAGGIHHEGSGRIENCILWGNESVGKDCPGAPDWCAVGDKAGTYFKYNCTSASIGTNCIVADPLFRAPAAGDFRIRPNSPCRDAGFYLDWMEKATDFWGNPRVDVQRRVDIGAHEEASSMATMLFIR